MKIAIVGSGLVGSLLAHGLQKLKRSLNQNDFEIHVYEKRPDPRRHSYGQGRSINLVLTSRGLHALAEIGLEDKAKKLAVPVYGRKMHPIAGESVFQPYGHGDECNYSISRSDLNHFLIDEAENSGVGFSFNAEIESADFERKQLHFLPSAQKATVSYDFVFATDGVGSAVRKALQFQFPDQFQSEIHWLEADYKELLIPAKLASGLESKALHIWARGSHMMMALANLDGGFTVTVYLPKSGSPFSFDQLKTENQVTEFFQEQFPDSMKHFENLSEEFLKAPQGALGSLHLNQWCFGNQVLMLGDASHAIVPFFGQGMNSGFEDVSYLLQNLKNHPLGVRSLLREDFLLAVQSERQPNTRAIREMALDNWIEMKEKVADPIFLQRKRFEAFAEEHFPNEFQTRYRMICYTLIPYSKAQKAGRLQDELWKDAFQNKLHQLPMTKDDLDSWKSKIAPIISEYSAGLKSLS